MTTPQTDTVSASRGAWNRLRWSWQRRVGWPGAAALGIAGISAVLAFGLQPMLHERGVAAERAHSARLAALAQQQARGEGAAHADAARLRPLPPVQQRGETVARLLDLVAQSGVPIDRAQYAAEDQEPDLSRLRVVLPFDSGYAQTRAAIGRVLNGLPNAALDGIVIERPQADARSLDGTLRLSLYFRKEAP